MSKSREQLNDYLKNINIEGKVVLDVGVQDKPTSRLTKGNASEYYTLDIDSQWNPDVVADLNTRDLDVLVAMKTDNAQIDTIFCIEVLEHCWNPVQVVANLCNTLRPGGTLYLSTPFINPHHDVVDYLRFTDEWYKEVLPKAGFDEVIVHERVATTGLEALQQFYKLEGMKYSKIRAKNGPYSYPVGYFVIARKGYGTKTE